MPDANKRMLDIVFFMRSEGNNSIEVKCHYRIIFVPLTHFYLRPVLAFGYCLCLGLPVCPCVSMCIDTSLCHTLTPINTTDKNFKHSVGCFRPKTPQILILNASLTMFLCLILRYQSMGNSKYLWLRFSKPTHLFGSASKKWWHKVSALLLVLLFICLTIFLKVGPVLLIFLSLMQFFNKWGWVDVGCVGVSGGYYLEINLKK